MRDTDESPWPSSQFEAGVELLGDGQIEAALTAFLAAAALFEESSPEDAAGCLHCAAECALELDDARGVVEYAQRALDLGGPADPGDRGACAYLLGCALVELAELDPARATFIQAYEWSCAAGEFAGAGQALRDASDIAYQRGLTEVAFEGTAEARRLFEQAGEDLQAVYCTQALGAMNHELGRRDAALTELTRAQREYEERDMPGDAAECGDRLGDLLIESGRMDDGVALLDKASSGYAAQARHLEASDCLRRAAMVFMRTGDVSSADTLLLRSTRELERGGETELAAEMELVRGALFSEVGRFGDELDAYARARKLFARTQCAAGIGWADANIASVKLVHGDPATAERMLLAAIPSLTGERAADARRMLITVYFETSQFDLAAQLLRQGPEAGASPERAADWLVLDGLLQYHRGRYEEAIGPLNAAMRTFRGFGAFAKLAQCRQTIAMCDYTAGRYAVAESALRQARGQFAVEQRKRDVAAVDLQLGAICMTTGRFPEALEAYERSRDLLVALGLANEALKATINIGALYIKWSRPADALATLRAAAPRPGATASADQPGSFQTGSFYNMLGAAEIISGNTAAGVPLLTSALKFFAANPAFRWHVAACHMNLGIAAMLDRRRDAALAEIANARAVFAELGLGTDMAKCDFFAATALTDSPVAGDDATHSAERERAYDLAIPASIFIDQQRLQFAVAPTRVAWAAVNLEFRAHLLRWAAEAGDAALVAELVESAINSGTHATKLPGVDSLLEVFNTTTPQPDTKPTGNTVSAGAGALIAGAILPMQPPPRLRMPDGHIALGRYINTAFSRYGGTPPEYEVAVI